MTMRKLTICLIAFAVAFSLCGIAFRSVTSIAQVSTQASSSVSNENMPARGGMPAVHDDELY
jgi:hypothetical protein